MDTTIRKKLQSNSKYNPFNAKYSYDEVLKFISTVDPYHSTHSTQTALCTKCFNAYYKEINSYIKMNLQKLNYNTRGAIQSLFAISNRNYYLLTKIINKQSGSFFSIEKLSKLKIKSTMDEVTDINIISAIEIQVDIINTIINTLKYFQIKPCSMLIVDNDSMNYLLKIYVASNMLCCLKSSYDVALWENGYIEIISDSIYHIKHENLEQAQARVIGHMRMTNNLFGNLNYLERLSTQNDDFNKCIFEKNLTSNVLENVWIDNEGYIQYTLKKGKNTIENTSQYAMALNEIYTYYPFITDLNFKDFENLSIYDLLSLFSELSSLVCLLTQNNFKNNIDDTKINNFSFKMRKNEVIGFLKQRTIFNERQILKFLSIIESQFISQTRIDFWKKPILLIKNDYYFLSANIIAPNYNFLVDEWLRCGGYDLEKRGKNFESYIKKELYSLLKKQGYDFYIPNKSKFYINNKDFEEIDLLLVLKDVVILAEVKCIKYPMDSRDINNNLKIIEKAGKQVNRKAKFISDNKVTLKDEIGDIFGKEFIRVIVTNYPVFAGIKSHDIPVIDYYLFQSYFRSGSLTHCVKLPTDKIIYTEEKYYSCEDELNRNLKDFIENPPSISELKQEIKMETQKITLPNASVSIYRDTLW